MLIALARQYANNTYTSDAIISNLDNKEDAFYKEVFAINPDTSVTLNKRLRKVIADIAQAKTNSNLKALAKLYPKGAAIFKTLCQTCHGADGNGITALAPPLNNSAWVLGDKNKTISIVLYGLTGPIKVAGKLYKAPEINGDMPGIGANKEFSDSAIAEVLNFIRNAWTNKATQVNPADITNIRNQYKGRQKTITMAELDK